MNKTRATILGRAVSILFVLLVAALLSFQAYAEPAEPVTDIVLNVNAVPSEGELLSPTTEARVRTLPDPQTPMETVQMMGIEYSAGSFANKTSIYDDSEVTYDVADYNSVQMVFGHMDDHDRTGFTAEIYLDDQLYGLIDLNGTMLSHLVTIDVSGVKNLRVFWEGYYGLGNVYGFTETVDTLQTGVNAPSPTDSMRQRTVSIEDFVQENVITEAEQWPCYENSCAMVYPIADKPMERFYMMGTEYGSGVSAYKNSIYDVTDASWNIGGRYQTMQFEAGHLDGADENAFGLEIYLDEAYYGTVDLTGTMMNQLVTIDVSDITKVRLSWQGRYGAGNVVFAGGTAAGEAAAEESPAAEEDMAAQAEADMQPSVPVDGNAEQSAMAEDTGIEAEGVRITPYASSCVLTYPVENKPVLRFYMMGEEFAQGLTAEKTSIYDDSEASYNIGKNYTTMEFTVGHLDDRDGNEFVMQVYLDEELKQEIPLSGNMMNESLTLDVSGITKVRFWWEGYYGIGNIVFR